MLLGRPVTDAFARNDGPEAVLERVDHGGANAAAGRAPGHDQGVDAGGGQGGRQRRAEEHAGVSFFDDRFRRSPVESVVQFDPSAATDEDFQRRNLLLWVIYLTRFYLLLMSYR